MKKICILKIIKKNELIPKKIETLKLKKFKPKKKIS